MAMHISDVFENGKLNVMYAVIMGPYSLNHRSELISSANL